MRFPGRTFLAHTHTEGASLAAILIATDRRSFPTEALHWDARLTADSDETWTEAFKHFEVSGTSNFSVPEKPADRKSTRLNSSHGYISYAVFCLKKKKNNSILRLQSNNQPLHTS